MNCVTCGRPTDGKGSLCYFHRHGTWSEDEAAQMEVDRDMQFEDEDSSTDSHRAYEGDPRGMPMKSW